MKDDSKDANPIGDEKPSEPQPVSSQEVRPPTLPKVKRSGITLRGDYFDDKFGRA